MADPNDVPLDPTLIKILSSDTRRNVLRLLKERRMTLTELARSLGLQKTTVLEHLRRMVDAGLIKRRDDERLWVYYELSYSGGQVVSPSPLSRFYISAAVIVAIGAVAVAMALTFGLGGGTGSEPMTPAPQNQNELRWVGSDDSILQDSDVVQAGHFEDAEERFLLASLDANTQSGAFRQGIDQDLLIQLEGADPPIDGTLLARNDTFDASATGAIGDNRATLSAMELDRLPVGEYELFALPEGAPQWAGLAQRLKIEPGNTAITPLHLVEGGSGAVTLSAPGLRIAPPVLVDGAGITLSDVGADLWRFEIPTLEAGLHEVQVGRMAAQTVTVHSDLTIQFRDTGQRVNLTLLEPQGLRAAGVHVLLDDVSLGLTDANGTLPLATLGTADHTLRLVEPRGEVIERVFNVASDRRIRAIDPLTAAPVWSTVYNRVRADVALESPVAEDVTLLGYEDSKAIFSISAGWSLSADGYSNLTTLEFSASDHDATFGVRALPVIRSRIDYIALSSPGASGGGSPPGTTAPAASYSTTAGATTGTAASAHEAILAPQFTFEFLDSGPTGTTGPIGMGGGTGPTAAEAGERASSIGIVAVLALLAVLVLIARKRPKT